MCVAQISKSSQARPPAALARSRPTQLIPTSVRPPSCKFLARLEAFKSAPRLKSAVLKRSSIAAAPKLHSTHKHAPHSAAACSNSMLKFQGFAGNRQKAGEGRFGVAWMWRGLRRPSGAPEVGAAPVPRLLLVALPGPCARRLPLTNGFCNPCYCCQARRQWSLKTPTPARRQLSGRAATPHCMPCMGLC